MKTLRITVSSVDVAKQDEPAFQKELTERFIVAGFDLSQNNHIIKQPRSDCNAMDFIQFQYTWFDRFDVQADYFMWKVYKWFKKLFV